MTAGDRRIFLSISLVGALAMFVSSSGASAGRDTQPQLARAAFAGGCFWCMEPPYDVLPGVASTTSGYIGGRTKNPTYEEVSAGGSGHIEAVEIAYDPSKIGYDKLLDVFWRNVDPLDAGGQFCDRGDQYRTAIFYRNDEEKRLAEASKQKVEAQLKKTVATEILPATDYYAAEGYHQDYYKKNPVRYKFYRWNCGRDQRLKELWGAEAGG